MYFYTIMRHPLKLTTVALLLLLLLSCRKETFTTDGNARLWTGVDTLRFDTVFTATGSATQGFKIFNRNEEGIKVESIRLAGGAASPFKININGQPGPQVADLEIKSGDSAYVFVTVNINPNAANLPFIVQDSVEIGYNGNNTKVHLQAFGQNAHFLKAHVIAANEVWEADKPYVITGSLRVQQGKQLTIRKGVRIYVHAGAPFIVDGTLKVEGEKEEEANVIFTGDRLDEPYKLHPGSWPGIQFTASSSGNNIRYAQIKNAFNALLLQEPAHNNTPILTLEQTIIDNAFEAGITAIGSSIDAQNVVVSNCGKNIVILKGGTYHFTHCTIAAYTNSFMQHKSPLMQLGNSFEKDNVVTTKALNAVFTNSIFWGESGGLVKEEIVLLQNSSAPFSVTFNGVLWNSEAPGATVSGNSLLQDPQFRNTEDKFYDFRLGENSPAVNKGVPTVVTLDADGSPRPVGAPDLGAYEQQ
jgi:hypothetical protein